MEPMLQLDNGCRGRCRAGGALAGLVVLGFQLGSLGLVAALFLGLVTAWLFGGFLVWAFCGPRPAAAAPYVAPPAPVQPVAVAQASPEPQPAPAFVAAPLAAPVAEPVSESAVQAPAPRASRARSKVAPVVEGRKPRALKAPRKAGADDLKVLEGIGPALEKACNELGIWHYDQIAKWGEAEVAWMDANLKGFRGRVSRDRWVAQAKIIVDEGLASFLERAKTNAY